MLDTAEKLSKLIKMDTKKITERDKKISGFSCILKAKAMMTKEQAMLADGSIKQDQYDKQLLSKIGKSQLDELSSKDLQVLAIFREMNAGTVLDPQMIKMKMSVKKSMQQFLSNFPNYQVLTRLWIGIENIHMATH